MHLLPALSSCKVEQSESKILKARKVLGSHNRGTHMLAPTPDRAQDVYH